MKSRVKLFVAAAVCLAAVCSSGCRQPDGHIPTKAGEQVNKTGDISRDLQNLAGKSGGALADLSDDLANLGSNGPPPELAMQLSKALEGALSGRPLPDQNAIQLADTLFVVVTAHDLSRKQIEQVEKELQDRLKQIGVADPAAEPVATAAYRLQTTVTTNTKRWYHLF